MNILITGASKGIGKAIALAFCRNSNHKLFLVSRDLQLLDELKQNCLINNSGCELSIYSCDLSKTDNIIDLVNKIKFSVDKIDILVNNAGILYNKMFDEISEDEINSMFKINFLAPGTLIRFMLPLLAKSGNAHVVNIGSMGGFQGSSKYAGLSYYSASKAALAVLTECLAEEYRDSGISFNCLALGAVQTEMFSEAFKGAKAPVSAEEMAEFIVNFSLTGHHLLNGKIIPLSMSDPK
jgi:3-oxoacyl-[acyl-carrier protein] reductase